MSSLTPQQVCNSYPWLLHVGANTGYSTVYNGVGSATPMSIVDASTIRISSFDASLITSSEPYKIQVRGALSATSIITAASGTCAAVRGLLYNNQSSYIGTNNLTSEVIHNTLLIGEHTSVIAPICDSVLSNASQANNRACTNIFDSYMHLCNYQCSVQCSVTFKGAVCLKDSVDFYSALVTNMSSSFASSNTCNSFGSCNSYNSFNSCNASRSADLFGTIVTSNNSYKFSSLAIGATCLSSSSVIGQPICGTVINSSVLNTPNGSTINGGVNTAFISRSCNANGLRGMSNSTMLIDPACQTSTTLSASTLLVVGCQPTFCNRSVTLFGFCDPRYTENWCTSMNKFISLSSSSYFITTTIGSVISGGINQYSTGRDTGCNGFNIPWYTTYVGTFRPNFENSAQIGGGR